MFKKYISKFIKTGEKKSLNFLDMPGYFNSFGNDNLVSSPSSYNQNVIVHRCVSLISSSASHVPWLVYKNHHGSMVVQQNHPITRLLKRPNPEKSGADFFTEIISSLLLFGNSYILAPTIDHGVPKEIYNLHARSTEIIFKDQYPVAYKYQNSVGLEKIYPINPVVSIKCAIKIEKQDKKRYSAS